jgi:Arc/MetJ-type ribon-helix-helix transcriptional regulator
MADPFSPKTVSKALNHWGHEGFHFSIREFASKPRPSPNRRDCCDPTTKRLVETFYTDEFAINHGKRMLNPTQ